MAFLSKKRHCYRFFVYAARQKTGSPRPARDPPPLGGPEPGGGATAAAMVGRVPVTTRTFNGVQRPSVRLCVSVLYVPRCRSLATSSRLVRALNALATIIPAFVLLSNRKYSVCIRPKFSTSECNCIYAFNVIDGNRTATLAAKAHNIGIIKFFVIAQIVAIIFFQAA